MDDVVASLKACEAQLAPHLARCKENGDLIEYNWQAKEQDRRAMFEHRHLLKELLMRNSSGIFHKTMLLAGMEKWNEDLEDRPLTLNKKPSFLRENMYNLQAMLLNVKATKNL